MRESSQGRWWPGVYGHRNSGEVHSHDWQFYQNPALCMVKLYLNWQWPNVFGRRVLSDEPSHEETVSKYVATSYIYSLVWLADGDKKFICTRQLQGTGNPYS